MTEVFGLGSTFAGYRVESLLGRGGMGVVYLATDLRLDRPVALKLIAPEFAEDEHFRRRFLNEPRLAASVDHPSVIPIYEAGEHDGQLYLAMRYVQGSDLGSVLKREGTLTEERALRILAHIAGGLDAAHRHALVHRDVKPANVLLDEEEHPYLTDFGITKLTSGAATETGQAIGTLDYMAPEQIRGEAVDGRSDQYALACVLYECLSGTPPFRRETQVETMWAHLNEEPPPLEDHPALEPALRKALAKGKDERHATCADLIRAAAAPQVARRARLRRRGRVLLAAGVLVLGATVAAGAALLGGEEEASADLGTVGNGIAAIDAASGKVAAFIESAASPSNVAVGEGAVWVLNTEDRTVSRIDPKTKAVTGRVKTRGVPTDIAAGEGAVWVGNGRGKNGNYTASISRIDPATSKITRTVKLPNRTAGSTFVPTFNEGFANIAVGQGAVWARNPDNTLSRLDPDTGKRVATIDYDFDKIAAGPEGVWVLSGPRVTRIDPRTNRAAETIQIGSESTAAIAVGAGAVWVTADRQGAVWRIDPGPNSETRSIDVGAGVTYLAFGGGYVWAANYANGTVARIDPKTNSVTARIPIGASQALAAGEGGAWVSTAGGAAPGELPASVCSEAVPAGARPDVMIVSDLPLQGPAGAGPRAMADAIRLGMMEWNGRHSNGIIEWNLVLQRHGHKAGSHTVGYRSCDDSTAQTGAWEDRRCAANANAYVHVKRLVAVVGPYNSPCASVQIPMLNRAPGGPLAMISPSNTWPGLTRGGPWAAVGGLRGEPGVYYPTGARNYFRLRPGDDMQGAAHAVLAKRLGLRSVFVIDDGQPYWKGTTTDPFRHAAEKLGLRIAGSAEFDPKAKSQAALAERVARSGAAGVVIAGDPFDGADRVVKAVRARLGEDVPILGGFLFSFAPGVLKQLGRDARGIYATSTDLPSSALPLSRTGRAFARDAGVLGHPVQGVLEAGQATELLMAAIARSDGTRASVLRELRQSEATDDILGSFRFDANGDMTTAAIPILRITGATPPGVALPPEFQGATIDRVVQVPTRLVK